MNELRYSVAIQKDYKVFYTACTLLAVLCSILSVVLSVGKCDSLAVYLFVTCITLFFLTIAFFSFFSISKKLFVCKGKVIYSTIFSKKTYKMSEIYSSKTSNEHVDYSQNDQSIGYGDDKITTFYSKDGTKLFHFGSAYDNVNKLKKDIINTQKSVAINKL